MNRVYRVIWNSVAGCWQVVAETARAKSKSGRQKTDSSSIAGKASLSPALRLAVIGLAATGAWAAPQGGQVTAGSATIQQSGATTTINQSSAKAAINWQSFSVGKSEAVRFNQPNANAVALNRVTGRESSQILGSLTANGKVFILNPNGVLFGNGAQVNVGGLIASTGKMTDADFMAGNYKITDAQGSVINAGNITAAPGGVVALIAPVVQNTGTIAAPQGSTLLAGAQAVTLKLQDGSLIGYTLDQGSLQTLVDNGGIIQAEGGHVVLTNKGLDALSKATINHSGVIEAQTVSSKNGVVELLGDMEIGVVNLAGKIDASAPKGGDGGFVETSAARVLVGPTTKVTTLSASGKTGQWLIDPVDFTIASAGGDMSGATLSALLQTSNMAIQSVAGGASGHGDLFVNDAVSWTANTRLSLDAERNVNINAPITGTGNSAGVAINPVGGDYYFGASGKITLPGDSATFSVMGNPYHVIHDVNQLQIVQNFPASRYVLGNDISAAATAGWNGGEGFVPIGSIERGVFSGIFDGLGHTIDRLTIQRPAENSVGLFGYTNPGARITNVGVINASISGYLQVGALLGFGFIGTKVSNSYATGSVTGIYDVGGLVGANHGDIVASHASVTVSGANSVGGLIGFATSDSVVSNSYASGAVAASSETAGGLIGYNSGIVTASHASGNISGVRYVGGLLGGNGGNVSTSYATGSVTGDYVVGGLVGYNSGNVETTLATGPVTGLWHVGGLLGENYGNVVNSRTSGSASGDDTVGGLVGYNHGTVVNSHVAGTVNGSSQVGGLVGVSDESGSVNGSYANSTVIGNNSVGGLLGTNRGVVGTSYATGSVSGSDTVGGLVGLNEGTVNTSHATGTVRGSRYDAGGLVGENLGDVSRSYATGEVTGVDIVGGLVGGNDSGTISESYATGAVAGSHAVGGLAGDNSGNIQDTYASGRVTGPDESGGLVGTNSGTISTSYSRGAVTGVPDQGGLVGYNEGDVNASYWDTQTSGLTYSDGGTGKTTLEMTRAATFAGWDFAGIWTITEGSSYPTLRSVPASAPASPVTPTEPSDLIAATARESEMADTVRLVAGGVYQNTNLWSSPDYSPFLGTTINPKDFIENEAGVSKLVKPGSAIVRGNGWYVENGLLIIENNPRDISLPQAKEIVSVIAKLPGEKIPLDTSRLNSIVEEQRRELNSANFWERINWHDSATLISSELSGIFSVAATFIPVSGSIFEGSHRFDELVVMLANNPKFMMGISALKLTYKDDGFDSLITLLDGGVDIYNVPAAEAVHLLTLLASGIKSGLEVGDIDSRTAVIAMSTIAKMFSQLLPPGNEVKAGLAVYGAISDAALDGLDIAAHGDELVAARQTLINEKYKFLFDEELRNSYIQYIVLNSAR